MLKRCMLGRRERFETECGIHRFQSLFVTLEGRYEYTVERQTQIIDPFTPVIFGKGVRFEKRVLAPLSFIMISAEPFPTNLPTVLTYAEVDRARLESSVLHLQSAILSGSSDEEKEHFFRDILLTANKTERRSPSSIQPIYDYIREHYTQRISLAHLSQMSGYSEQTVIHKFKAHYGTSPARLVHALRIERAKVLLSGTDLSVGQVADACGYENVYYFSNSFKKETGCSPLKYRRDSLL